MNSSSMLHLRLFGSPSLAREDGAPLTGRAVQRHRLALLSLLALSPGRSLSRDKLLTYLWPERDTEHARLLLNQAVHTLRKALGEEVLRTAGDELRLGTGVLKVDVIAFQEALAAGHPERAVGLYAGPFLDGFFLSDAPEFERWVEGERERLAGAYGRALEALAEAAEEQGDFSGAVERWKARAAHDPYDSRVALRLMQALETSGNRAGALQHAAIHQRLLQEELGIEPASAVRVLAERLRSAPTELSLPEVGRRDEAGKGTPSSATLPLRGHKPIAVPLAAAPEAEAGDGALRAAGPAGMRRPRRWPARHWATAMGLLGLGGLAMLLAASLLRQANSPALHPQRVFVAPFENRTGDPALDPLGSMAADWIVQSLSRTADVEVVTTTVALAAVSDVPGAVAENAALDRFGALAKETGAALVVAGAYYLQADSLQFHVQLTDARERRLLRSLEPITGAPANPGPAIEELSRRAAAAVAVVLDTRLAAIGNLASQPTNYEAYHACLEGLNPFFASDWPAATRHFERSMRLDSTYLFPLLHIGYVRLNVGDFAGADSVVHVLNGSRERMMPFELAILDLLTAKVAADPVASYAAARRAAAIGPGSPPNVQWGAEALRLNRPREAIQILSAIDPEAAPVGGWPLYWRSLTSAHHLLGNHRQEVWEARRARALYPSDAWPLLLEARALAARGRTNELETLLLARRSLPDFRDPPTGAMMTAIGHELGVHGHLHASREWLERALEWYRTRPAEDQAQAGHRRELAFALLATDQPGEAERIFHDLAAADPDDVEVTGVLGVLAARRGDSGEAERIAGRLATLRRPYRNGEQLLWRACIAAHRGQLAAAVSLLQEAAGRAAHFEHTHICLDPLRDYPPFRELMRPKG